MMTRLLSAVALSCCLVTLASPQSVQPRFDVLIRHGQLLDGTGAPAALADVGIRDGRIASVGRLDDAIGARTVDATGLTVTPGFIDVHSHASTGLAGALKEGRQLLAQGITTVALNPDGGGPVDIKTERATYERQHVGVNVMFYAPHG